MIDDHDGCEWMNVSSGTGSPGLFRQIPHSRKTVVLCVCVCVSVPLNRFGLVEISSPYAGKAKKLSSSWSFTPEV